MAEKGILFKTPMVQAILRGEKTQTRRVIKHQHLTTANELDVYSAGCDDPDIVVFHDVPMSSVRIDVKLPYAVGDRLWVRETWRARRRWDDTAPRDIPQGEPVHYQAEKEVAWNPQDWGRWRPSIFLPQWAARIWLEVTAVRVERLQEISVEDARVETGLTPSYSGVEIDGLPLDVWGFKALWDSINAKTHPWGSNPWVGVYEFRRVQ